MFPSLDHKLFLITDCNLLSFQSLLVSSRRALVTSIPFKFLTFFLSLFVCTATNPSTCQFATENDTFLPVKLDFPLSHVCMLKKLGDLNWNE